MYITKSNLQTVFHVLRSNTAHGSAIVCHGFLGFDELVVNTIAVVVDERDASKNARLASFAYSHHLTVHRQRSSQTKEKKLSRLQTQQETLRHFLSTPHILLEAFKL